VLPVVPDQLDRMEIFWDSLNTGKANQIVQYFEVMGYSRVIAALQTLPHGRFVVEFIRGTTDLRLNFPRNRHLDLPIADYVRSEVSNFSGFDYTAPENIPEIKSLWKWSDRKAYPAEAGKCRVFTMPVRPGKTHEAIQLYDTLRGEKAESLDADLRQNNVMNMEAFLQYSHEGHANRGAFISHCIQSPHPLDDVVYRLTTGESDIARYYRNKLNEITGFDCAKKWQLPRIDLLFDWSAKNGIMTSSQRATTTL
jgi:hypothetical protein